MSKTKDQTPKEDKAEKKRKRQEQEGDDVPKKSKKSKKSEDDGDATPSDEPVAETTTVEKTVEKAEKNRKKEERKEKAVVEDAPAKDNKSKKSKKSKKVDVKDESAQAADAATLEKDIGAKDTKDFTSLNTDVPMPDATDGAVSKKDKKKSKKDKKDKKPKDTTKVDNAPSEDQDGVMEDTVPQTDGTDADDKAAKKEKKKEKKEKKDKEKKEKKTSSDTNGEAASEEQPAAAIKGEASAEEQDAEAGAEADGEETAESGKKGRFIVFVGNLPYTATKESIAEHFAKLHPTDIRLRTYKGTEKFMGTCFIEFDRFDRMETCLKKYHHSVFPDGKKKEGRKINVELSAGGGGNSEARKSKIVAKNDKLHDERVRDKEKRAELEAKQGERKEKKEAKQKKGDKKGEKGDAAPAEEEAEPDNAGMHPARLAMMQQQPPRPTHRKRF